MAIDPTDPRPPYVQLADGLRERIRTGELAPGQPVPSVRSLAADYGVTTVTANRALDMLRSEGLVDTQPGRGTFVRGRKPVIRVSAYLSPPTDGARATWREEGDEQGFRTGQEITGVATVPAPEEIAELLALPPGSPTVVRRRVLTADDVPVQTSDSYYPDDIAGGTELAAPGKLRGYTFAALARLGYEIDHFRDDFHVRMPTPDETRVLRLGRGVPVLRLLRTTFATDGRAIEVADMVLAGDRYVLSYHVPAQRPAAPGSDDQ
jgi:GntR family transcriptional regulator